MSALKAIVTMTLFILLMCGGGASGVGLLMKGYPFAAFIAAAALFALAVRVMFVGLAWAYPR